MKKLFFLKYHVLILILIGITVNSCKISYKFNGAVIDYTKTKTISIADFPNMAEYIYAPLSSTFTEALRDKYARQTRLQIIRTGGDMDVEGEIKAYTATPLSIGTDAFAAETRLELRINVRFNNKANPEEYFEKEYSSSQTFDSNNLLETVQDALLKEMIDEICDNIFNDTAGKW